MNKATIIIQEDETGMDLQVVCEPSLTEDGEPTLAGMLAFSAAAHIQEITKEHFGEWEDVNEKPS